MDMALASVILLFGAVVVLSLLGKSLLLRVGLPALAAYIPIGILLRAGRDQWDVMPGEAVEVFAFLGELGVAVLLFRVGFETDLVGLRKQLRRASVVWAVSMLVSGAVGYFAATWLLGLGAVPSLFVATALTATSVGVSIAVWQEAGRLRSDLGDLLVDVAELDDISAVILMGILLSVAPLARNGLDAALPVVLSTAGAFLLKAVAFAAACFLLARYAEAPVARFLHHVESPHDAVLSIIALGLIIASAAAFLGFSIAVGAFLAGLVFRGEESAFRHEGGFDLLYGMFVPFFFVGIGLMVTPEALTTGVGLMLALFVAAVLGKVLGAGIPAGWLYGGGAGPLIGVSMVPRAEIGLIVMQQGRALGPWAVPPELFTAMVGVAALTSIGAPFVVRLLLRPVPEEEPG